ncbi:MAG: XRE family transcriptional regulator [Nostocaceae cyanobacterium]|nr:XRE family transcriptional regulator [Nostocaceae cyanobacterium]
MAKICAPSLAVKPCKESDFIEKYKINQLQLALLLGVFIPLVRTWFALRNPRQLEQRYLDRLSEIDALLEITKVIDEKLPPHLQALFNLDK